MSRNRTTLFIVLAIMLVCVYVVPGFFTEPPEDISRLAFLILSLIPVAFWLGILAVVFALWEHFARQKQAQGGAPKATSSKTARIALSLVVSVGIFILAYTIGAFGTIDTGLPIWWIVTSLVASSLYFLVCLIRILR